MIQSKRRRRNKILSLETPLTIPASSMISGEEGEERVNFLSQVRYSELCSYWVLYNEWNLILSHPGLDLLKFILAQGLLFTFTGCTQLLSCQDAAVDVVACYDLTNTGKTPTPTPTATNTPDYTEHTNTNTNQYATNSRTW